jgi:thymidylate synthase
MSSLIELPDLQNGYIALLDFVRTNGRYSSPRGQSTIECENVTFTVEDLEDTLPTCVGRKPSLLIAAVEALQLIGGISVPELVVAASRNFEAYREPGGGFWGAYGNRVAQQYLHVIEKLTSDIDSRQAVVTLWSPELDNDPGHKDYPCTIALGFRLRNDRLNLSVTMRSNDVWLGVCYDVFQFTQLQHTLARILGVEAGTYSHTAWSLHIYERDLESADALHQRDRGDVQFIPAGVESLTWAKQLLLRQDWDAVESWVEDHPNERWYHNLVLQTYARMNRDVRR